MLGFYFRVPNIKILDNIKQKKCEVTQKKDVSGAWMIREQYSLVIVRFVYNSNQYVRVWQMKQDA